MSKRIIRIVLNEETFLKYKVLCAMADVTMTDQTNEIIRKYIEEMSKTVKFVRIEPKS